MKFLSNKNYAKAVEDLVSNKANGGEIRCAIAFWGLGAVKRFGKYFGKDTRIVCNLMSGGTNPAAIRKLHSKRVPIRTLDDLHAKVYLSASAGIIGSANCSINGLSVEEGEGWLEAGVLVTNPNLLGEMDLWFESVWDRARDIEKNDFDRAEERWQRMRENRPMVHNSGPSKKIEKSLISAMKRSPEKFEGRNIYFVINTHEGSDEGKKQAKSQRWKENEYYEDYSDLPEGMYIDMDTVWVPTKINGLLKSRKNHPSVRFGLNGESIITHVEALKSIEGLKLTQTDKIFLKNKVEILRKKFGKTRKADKEGGFWVPFEDARKCLFP